MSLIELIAGVEAREPTLTVFNADPAVTQELREHFADRNVRIAEERTDAGPEGYAVLSRDGEFVTAVAVDELLPGVGDDPAATDETGAADDGPLEGETPEEVGAGARGRVGEPILDHLDETMFTSYSHADMVAASREIEDRAWRVGDGELHAGFQTLDVLTGETDTYDLLGEKDRLSVHAYAANEGDPPDVEHYTVHVGETAEIRETWFVGPGVRRAAVAPLVLPLDHVAERHRPRVAAVPVGVLDGLALDEGDVERALQLPLDLVGRERVAAFELADEARLLVELVGQFLLAEPAGLAGVPDLVVVVGGDLVHVVEHVARPRRTARRAGRPARGTGRGGRRLPGARARGVLAAAGAGGLVADLGTEVRTRATQLQFGAFDLRRRQRGLVGATHLTLGHTRR